MMKALALAFLLAARAEAAPTTGAAFLRLDPSARSSAMGGAYTAFSGSAENMFFNPAGIGDLGRREMMAGHAEWLAGTTFDTLAFGQPTRWGGLGVSALRLGSGSIEGRAADRTATGGFDATDAVYAVSAAHNFGPAMGGASLKFLRSEIGPFTAQTVAVDLGAKRNIPGYPVTLGLSVLNLGKGLKFISQEDPLPMTFAAGAVLRIGGVLGLAMDVRHEPLDHQTSVALGTEYAFMGPLSLRAGYGLGSATRHASQGSLAGLGAGVGFKMRAFNADYAFTPFGELGDVQRLTLAVRFR